MPHQKIKQVFHTTEKIIYTEEYHKLSKLTFSCLRRFDSWVNFLPQMLHANGVNPEWCVECLSSEKESMKPLPHTTQMTFLTRSWTVRTCRSNANLFDRILLHLCNHENCTVMLFQAIHKQFDYTWFKQFLLKITPSLKRCDTLSGKCRKLLDI